MQHDTPTSWARYQTPDGQLLTMKKPEPSTKPIVSHPAASRPLADVFSMVRKSKHALKATRNKDNMSGVLNLTPRTNTTGTSSNAGSGGNATNFLPWYVDMS